MASDNQNYKVKQRQQSFTKYASKSLGQSMKYALKQSDKQSQTER